MNSYEVTIVLPADSKDKELLARVEKEVKNAGGTINKTEEWGKRELAYAIKKHGGPAGGYREGVYFSLEVSLPADKVGGINRFLETSEGVLRHLIVRTKSKFQSAHARTANVKSSSKPKVKNAKSKKSKKVVKRKNGNKKSK